jgi:3-polyprenyl-4-hydroxybenzoate decarboxylase
MRNDAIFHALAPNNAAEHLLLSGLPKQARISRSLIDSMHVSALRDIIWPVEGTHFICFLTLDEKMSATPGLAKQYALLLLRLDHYVKYVTILPEGTDITDIVATFSTIAARCDFRLGSGVEVLGGIFGQYLDPSSPEAGLTSKMIIDATGSKRKAPNLDIETLRKMAKRIKGVEDITFPDICSSLFAVVKVTPSAKALDILGKLAKHHRLIVIVDRDIDIEDPRETLWAIATRTTIGS